MKLSKHFVLCTVVLGLGLGAVQAQSPTDEAVFSGTLDPRCIFTAPSRTLTDYLQVDSGDTAQRDGFFDTFQATVRANRSLWFTIMCNGAKANITFSHPVQVEGPSLAPNTRFVTRLLPNTGNALLTLQGTTPSATTTYFSATRSSTPQRVYFYSTINNGGTNASTGRVPLLAGEYKFELMTSITASL